MTDDMELVYIAAFRYALGRMSYIVSVVAQELGRAKLSRKTKELIVTEIDEAIKEVRFGMACDRDEWIRLKDKLVEELT